MRKTIHISTHQHEVLVNITEQVKAIIRESNISNGLVNVYAQGATAAIMIQENWDDSVQTDVVNLLQKMIPKDLLGRVQTLTGTISMAAIPLGQGLMGIEKGSFLTYLSRMKL